MENNQLIKKVVIVGGGTAGWLTANHLAKKLKPKQENGIKIILLESPDIPTIGVGEGTVPMIRKTLRDFGISETELIKNCDATFKQSIKFFDWTYNPDSTKNNNQYHHLFDYPWIENIDLTSYWLSQNLEQQLNHHYADTVSFQASIADSGLAPKLITHPEYIGESDYAYHLDAGKFSEILKKNAIESLGVEHLYTNVESANLDADGEILSLVCKETDDISGDFFVDCTGFNSLLLGQKLKVPFIDKGHQLFADHAVVMQVNYEYDDAPIPCFTLATAQKFGWIWDIGLFSRRGVGHVYSNHYCSHEQAERQLRSYVGEQAKSVESRRIAMKIGYREKFWVKNCVAIGLSQGFVEPLEATGLLVFDVTASMLAENFPVKKSSMPLLAKQFNQVVGYGWQRVIDFIKLHYFLSQRDDSDFWLDNRNESSVPNSLLEKLSLWKIQPPTSYDFFTKHEIFNLDNYLYVLYGMNFQTTIDKSGYLFNNTDKAKAEVEFIRQRAEQLSQQLLPHRQLIKKIKRHGLHKI